MGGTGCPFFLSVHIPLGPLKSGMPMLVLMPAPVKAKMEQEGAERSERTSFALVATSSIESWCSGHPSWPPRFFLCFNLSAYPSDMFISVVREWQQGWQARAKSAKFEN